MAGGALRSCEAVGGGRGDEQVERPAAHAKQKAAPLARGAHAARQATRLWVHASGDVRGPGFGLGLLSRGARRRPRHAPLRVGHHRPTLPALALVDPEHEALLPRCGAG